MKVLFISKSGESLPICYRLKKEKVDCSIYTHLPGYKKNYEGMGIEKVSLSGFNRAVKSADTIFVDMIKRNDNTKEDRALLKITGCSMDAPSVFSAVTDTIKDKLVIGSSVWTDNLEFNGNKYAKDLGMRIPFTYDFTTLAGGIKFLKANKKVKWVFRYNNNSYVEKYKGELIDKMLNEFPYTIGDVDYVLQKVINGFEVSTEGWFDGEGFTSFNHTIEQNKMMNDDLGMSIGSQSNMVWVAFKSPIIDYLNKMVDDLKKAKYIGPVNVNCIVSKSKSQIFFLEWTCHTGFDKLYNLLNLVEGSLADFIFKQKAKFGKGFSVSERITIPPFPYSSSVLLKQFAKGVTVAGNLMNLWMEDVYFNEGIKCATSDGIIGVQVSRDINIDKAWDKLHRSIEQLKISSPLQYRTDGAYISNRRYNILRRRKVIV